MLDFLNPETELLEALDQPHTCYRPRLPDALTQDDRWLAASALQKAIRRGHVEHALYAASIVKSFSSTHLWNRLRVIALEDVGIANLNIVSQILWVAGKEQWKASHAKRCDRCDCLLNILITQLCQSGKSRTLDDVLYAAEYHPLYAPYRLVCGGMNEAELMAAFHDPKLDVVEQTLVCRYLCGRRYRSEVLNLPKGNPAQIMELAKAVNAPPYVIDILSLSRGQEYFTCLLPCLMQLEQSEHCDTIEINTPLHLNGLYIDAAYDRHTRHGKTAFRRFLKSHPIILDFIRKHCDVADPVNLVGWAVFSIEGQILNRRILYDGSECIGELAVQSWLYSGGMGLDVQDAFLALIKEHWEGLQDARRSVAR